MDQQKKVSEKLDSGMASAMLTWFPDGARRRIARYGLLLPCFFLLANLLVIAKPYFNFMVSDGRGYYLWLPSMVVDGDLDLENQIREHSDVDFREELLHERTATGYVRNKFPAGLSASLLPAFLAAHGLSVAGHALTGASWLAPHGYSVLYQLFVVAQIMAMGLFTMIMADLLIRRLWGLPGWATGLAVVLFWTGTHYAYYYFREPVMVHVVSAFWVTVVIWCAVQIAGLQETVAVSPDFRRKFILWGGTMTFSLAMAGICRPTNAFVVMFLLAVICRYRSLVRAAGWSAVAVAMLPALPPLLLQITIWRVVEGSFIAWSYGDERFNWGDPHLLSTLFSSRHGLFFWSPLLLLSFTGLILQLRAGGRQVRQWLWPLTAAALLLWYLNASWHCWWFGDAFGGRAFLELAVLFVAGLAFFLVRVPQWTRGQQILLLVFVVFAYVWQYALMGLYITHRIPRGDPLVSWF
jgi:hypothetical protein